MSDYTDSGALFKNNDKKGDNHPDCRGNIEISAAMLQHLNEQYKAGQPLKVDIAGWNKESPKAGRWVSLKVSKPFVKDGGGARRASGEGDPF